MALLFNKKKAIIGSIILTDKCNLACRHCAVSNINSVIYPYEQVQEDMRKLIQDGVRILLFYGGEPFLWADQGKTLRDLVIEARKMGFLSVNVVTNGTYPLDLPEADLILVSLDGGREAHNAIRGETYDLILENIEKASTDRIVLYMAVNRINQGDLEVLCEIAKQIPSVRAVSFNFHTPYPGTESLSLSRTEKQTCCDRITSLMDRDYPVLNLRSAFPYIVDNTFRTPCYQCVVIENGERWVCGRCIDIDGLCGQCGYFFAAELSLVFGGNIRVMIDLLKTYLKYL
jgi:MoaA/NifB/PqqE/SkfB family radical SAM enzyme